MNIELFTQITKWLDTILLFVALFFSITATKHLFTKNYREEIMHIKKIVFLLFTTGLGFLGIAFTIDDIYQFLGKPVFSLPANIFFSISYVFFILAFAYFWSKSERFHNLPQKELLFFLSVIFIVSIWLYYLFVGLIIPKIPNLPLLNKLFVFFNPLAVSSIFIFTLVVHPRLKAGVIRTPLWYLSCGIFVYFIGYMFLIYSYWYPKHRFIPIIYSVLFLFSLLYFLLGSFAAKRKFSSPHRRIAHHTIKKLTRSL